MAKLSERLSTPQNVLDGVDYLVGIDLTPSVPVSNVNCTVKLNNTGETKMGIRTVNLTLIDNDTNLKGAEKIVFQSQVVTEHDNDKTIQQVLITGDVAKALVEHNEKRSGTVDKAVLRSTGTEVYLEPVEIFELQWQVVQVG
jgi:hypothetical protein